MQKLSIIIPVYNEENYIEKAIKAAVELSLPVQKEVIVVNDGSTDKTVEAIMRCDQKGFKFIDCKVNRGKGAAYKEGVKVATGDYIIPFDADLEYDINDIHRIIQPILDGYACVVYGSRRLEKSNKQYSGLSFYIGGVGLTMICNLLYFSSLTDEPCCYKLTSRKLFNDLNIECDKFDWEPELTAKILKKGIRIYDVPSKYFPRDKQAGKKIKWKDGVSAVLTLLKWRFKRI